MNPHREFRKNKPMLLALAPILICRRCPVSLRETNRYSGAGMDGPSVFNSTIFGQCKNSYSGQTGPVIRRNCMDTYFQRIYAALLVVIERIGWPEGSTSPGVGLRYRYSRHNAMVRLIQMANRIDMIEGRRLIPRLLLRCRTLHWYERAGLSD